MSASLNKTLEKLYFMVSFCSILCHICHVNTELLVGIALMFSVCFLKNGERASQR